MVTAALVALLLAAQCPPEGPVIVPPDVGACGYGFVMEIAGWTVDSVLAQTEGQGVERALPDGGAIRITFDRVMGSAGGPECTPLRIVITASVRVLSGGCWSSSRATILLGSRLNVTGGGDKPLVLGVQPVPDAIVVTSDAPDPGPIEELIAGTGPQLAEKLAASIPLEGLTAVARARPDAALGVGANAYQLGFVWILQVYGAVVPEPACVPQVFLQGDVFTLVLNRQMIAGFADQEFRLGNLPKRLNSDGLIDSKGDISIEGIAVDVAPDTLLIDWHGLAPDCRKVDIRWRMAFVDTVSGLALQIREITVDGQQKAVPEEAINPFDELIQAVAAGPKRTGLLVSPMGRMRLTTGAISSEAIIVAGRV